MEKLGEDVKKVMEAFNGKQVNPNPSFDYTVITFNYEESRALLLKQMHELDLAKLHNFENANVVDRIRTSDGNEIKISMYFIPDKIRRVFSLRWPSITSNERSYLYEEVKRVKVRLAHEISRNDYTDLEMIHLIDNAIFQDTNFSWSVGKAPDEIDNI